MSKQLTIINGANIYALNFLKQIRGYNKIVVGDIYNSRRHFIYGIHNARTNDPSTTFEHKNINSPSLLESTIMGSDTVVYFTHDYFSMVEDKNSMLIKTAELAKKNRVDRLIAVTPLEFVNYQTASIVDCPIKDLDKATNEAISIFDKTTIIKPDLVFGSNTYFVKFLMQCWAQSYSYLNHDFFKHHKFNPIYWNDLNSLLEEVLENPNADFFGKKFVAKGKEAVSFADIDNFIRQVYCPAGGFQQSNEKIKSLIESFQLFFHGNTHTTNFGKMLHHLQGKEFNTESYADLSDQFSYKTKSIREYYSQKADKIKAVGDINNLIAEKENDNITYPDFKSYWGVSLN